MDKLIIKKALCELHNIKLSSALNTNEILFTINTLEEAEKLCINNRNGLAAKSSIVLQSKLLSQDVSDEIAKCMMFYRDNPNEAYPVENNLLDKSNEANNITITSEDTQNCNEDTSTKASNNITLDATEEFLSVMTSNINSLNEILLKTNKENQDFHAKYSQFFMELKERLSNSDKLQIDLLDKLSITNDNLTQQSNDIKNTANSIKESIQSLPSQLAFAIQEPLKILNNSDILDVAKNLKKEMEENIIDLYKKTVRNGDFLAQQIIDEAQSRLPKLNEEHISKLNASNKTLLIYGLVACFTLSIGVGAFVGKLVGSYTGNAAISHIDTLLAQSQKKQQQQQIKSQVNKKGKQ